MPNILDILARAQSLMNETALNSITPPRAGGIMYDTLLVLNQMQLEGASLLISKVYASVSAMEADTAPTSDLTGRALKPGQLVVIVTSDTSSSDMGSEYRYNGPGSWTYVGKVGGLPLDTVPTQNSTKGITSGGVYAAQAAIEEDLTQLEREVNGLVMNTSDADVHQVNTSSAVETTSGVRLRLVFYVHPGYLLEASCSLGKGVAANVYNSLENAVKSGTNQIQTISSAYLPKITSFITNEGYLSVSLCKSDSSAFSAQDKEDFLAATEIRITNQESLKDDISNLKEAAITPIYEEVEAMSGYANWANGYIKTDGTIDSTSTSYKYSDAIFIKPNSRITINKIYGSSGTIVPVAAYTEQNEYVSACSYTGGSVSPSSPVVLDTYGYNIKYIRITYGGGYTDPSVKIVQNTGEKTANERVRSLEETINGGNDNISSFGVHQVLTSSATENPSGTRIRLVRKVSVGMRVSGQCTAGKGMAVDIYSSYENALKCPSADLQQSFTGGAYTALEWNGIVEVDGYLSVSLCKNDSSAFSAQEKRTFLAASTLSVVYDGLDDKIGVLEGDVVLSDEESAVFGVNNWYINYTDGVMKNVSGYKCTQLYPLENLERFDYRIHSGGTVAAVIAFFGSTDADSYVSGVGGSSKEYRGTFSAEDFPVGAKYVAFSGKTTLSATLIYKRKIKPVVKDSDDKIGFLYKSYTDALYVLRKKTGVGYSVSDSDGTRMRVIFKVPKGTHFKVASSNGVAVGLYADATNAILSNTSYTEIYTPTYNYFPEVSGETGQAGFLSISLTNGNTAINDEREAELLSSLSLVVGYGMGWDIYFVSTKTGEDVSALNKDMDDALVSVGGVNSFDSGTYDSFTTKKKNLSILAISDIHGTFDAISRAVEYANAKANAIDYVACLGDVVLRSPADPVTDFEDSFADSVKPFLFVVGNHDTADTGLAGITEAEARTKYFSQIVSKGWISNFLDANSCSWYKDDSTHKVRMISVFEYGNSQTIASGAPNTYCRRWIPTATLQWFADILYSTPSDYSVVVLLHQIPFFPATYVDGKFTINENMRISLNQFFLNTVDGNPFGDIVDAFINGTSITKTYDSISSYGLGKTATVSKDFSVRGEGAFICFVVGHFHGSYVFTDATYPEQKTIVVPSGSQSAFQQNYGDTNYAPNSRNEDQFYVIGFDTEKKIINIAKIGGQVTNDMVKRDIISIPY